MEPLVVDLDSRRDGIRMPKGWKPLPPSIGPEARPTGDELPSYVAPAVDRVVELPQEQIDRPPQTIEMPPGWVPLPGAGIADMSEGWAQRLLAARKARQQSRANRQNELKAKRKETIRALNLASQEAPKPIAGNAPVLANDPWRADIVAKALAEIGEEEAPNEAPVPSAESLIGKSIPVSQARKLGIEVRGHGPIRTNLKTFKPRPIREA